MEQEAQEAAARIAEMFNSLAEIYILHLAACETQEEFNKTQEKSFVSMRETFVKRFKVSKIKAANMVRIVLAIVRSKCGDKSIDDSYIKGALANAF